MLMRKAPALLCLLLAACGPPGPRATLLESGPSLVSYRGTVELQDEMAERAARHCAEYGRMAVLRYLRNQGVTGEVYALYSCV